MLTGVSVINMAQDYEFGPKMLALSDKQRAFVMFMVEHPLCSRSEAARAAGYSDTGGGDRVIAHRLMQDQRIIDAMHEQAGKRMWALSMKAAHRVDQMIDSDDEAIALKAAVAVLDRTGFGAQQNINVNQTVRDETGKALIERIAHLAQRLNVPVQGLLKQQTAPVVEGEFTEVKGDDNA